MRRQEPRRWALERRTQAALSDIQDLLSRSLGEAPECVYSTAARELHGCQDSRSVSSDDDCVGTPACGVTNRHAGIAAPPMRAWRAHCSNSLGLTQVDATRSLRSHSVLVDWGTQPSEIPRLRTRR